MTLPPRLPSFASQKSRATCATRSGREATLAREDVRRRRVPPELLRSGPLRARARRDSDPACSKESRAHRGPPQAPALGFRRQGSFANIGRRPCSAVRIQQGKHRADGASTRPLVGIPGLPRWNTSERRTVGRRNITGQDCRRRVDTEPK